MSNIVVAKPWEGITNPIRNTNQPYLKFINSGVFQEEGRHFLKYGYYTDAPYGTKDYNDYWDEQERRVLNGYTVGGVRVTGRHYFYLNFCLIKARPIDPHTGAEKQGENRKIITLPRFLDHNYYWFNEFEKCCAEGPWTNHPKMGMIVAKSRRKGFQQPNSEPVMTPNGPVTMGELMPGSQVLTPNGIASVTEIFPQGASDVYEITLFDGRKVRCGYEHLWKIYRQSTQKHTPYILSTKELLQENLKPGIAYKWFLKVNEPVEYSEKKFTIPPYTLGAILGDGNVTKQMKISGIDKDIIENILVELNHQKWKFGGYFSAHLAYAANWQITFYNEYSDKYREYYNNKFACHINPLYEELKRIKLNVKSRDKFIPEEYKYSSKEQRLALVKGMMDTDGSIVRNGAMSFSNVSERLVRDLQNVLYSLGITSTLRQRKDRMFILYINTSENIFGIKRKQERLIPTRVSRDYVAITDIKKLDYQEESTCISIDSEEKVYLTRDYIPTHNTYQVTGGVYGYNFNFLPASMNILAAYEKGHYKVTLDGIHFTINHINRTTDWGKKQGKLHQRDHFRASFIIKNPVTGIEIEDGYMSEIQAISFKDNPFKSIGESTDLMGYEEAGKFEHLLTAYTISEPTFRDGDIMTGVPLIWGTGGDMEKGTKDFAELYYDPAPYGLMSYENIYDENATGDCGWFIDDMWYYPGTVTKIIVGMDGKEKKEELPFVDSQGNSIRNLAEESLDTKRAQRKKGSRAAYNKFVTQQPKNPAEAFMRVQGTMFDTVRASARLSQIETNRKMYLDSIWKAKLTPDPATQKIKFEYDDISIPLYEFPIKSNKQKGCIEIFEMPVTNDIGEVPFGRYIAGIDAYDDDESTTNSVGSILVLDLLTDRIVCQYKGRPETADTFFETCRRILKFYNAVANYERNKKGLYGYFYNKNCLYLLCDEPEILKDKGISKSNTFGNNSKGTMASPAVNIYGLQRSLQWMSMPAYGEPEGSEIITLDKIRPVPLLKEIIGWNPDDNFDDISALGMLMILREDRLQFKAKINKVKIKEVSQDDFFSRHLTGTRKGYTNRKIIDFIRTEDIKLN